MKPYGLTAEQRVSPLGLDVARPRLSWKLSSPQQAAAQTQYRLTAALSPADLDQPDRLIWDTGRVTSGETLLIAWDGPQLTPSTRYHWRITAWSSNETEESADSWFETGLLAPEAWQAGWIGRDAVNRPPMDPPTDHDRTVATHALPPPLYLRRSFTLERVPVKARLYSTAHGVYQPRLNGSRIGDGELAPGWTEYRHRVQYQTHDVTDALQAGENVLAAVVADGWWAGYVGFDPRKPALHYGDAPAFLAHLVLWFEDGSQRSVTTDGEWTEGPGAIQFSDMLMGEYVDARGDAAGWDAPGFVDAAGTEDAVGNGDAVGPGGAVVPGAPAGSLSAAESEGTPGAGVAARAAGDPSPSSTPTLAPSSPNPTNPCVLFASWIRSPSRPRLHPRPTLPP